MYVLSLDLICDNQSFEDSFFKSLEDPYLKTPFYNSSKDF